MDSEHRKIELQSPADLTYLTAKIRTLARQKLDLHLPAQADATEPDELRKQVEDLVDAFVTQVLAGMKANISINGIDVVSRGGLSTKDKRVAAAAADDDDDAMDVVDENEQDTNNPIGAGPPSSLSSHPLLEDGVVEVEEFEPFDDKLRARLSAAVQKRDALVAKISNHRRATPALAAARFADRFEREMRAMDAERDASLETAGEALVVVGVDPLKRQDEVERSWERALEGLLRLNQGLPETRARLERCGDVVGYLEGKAKG